MQGTLKKMRTALKNPVHYELLLSDNAHGLNPFLGQTIKLTHTGNIFCLHCGRLTKKSFNQGYCYPCFASLAQCDMCILKPETCHYEKGTCREPGWGETFCMQTHYVYLANSSGIKVGITRQNQIPTRWIDQGAIQALPIFKVSTRQISGMVEVIIAKHVSDKTSWQQMLKNHVGPIDLVAKRDELLLTCQEELTGITKRFGEQAVQALIDEMVVDIHYPVELYPVKVKSLSFDKTVEISGVLQGIKGQYLIMDTGVVNLRKFSGYEIKFSVLEALQTIEKF